MRILYIVSGNNGKEKEGEPFNLVTKFLVEQLLELQKHNVSCKVFFVHGKSLFGYLNNYFRLKRMIKTVNPDLLHAHYGFCGMLAVLQFNKNVMITFHGSDINLKRHRIISNLACWLSKGRIFVSQELYKKIILRPKENYKIIPCGVDLTLFSVIEKEDARELLNLSPKENLILFSSDFKNKNKNSKLANQVISRIPGSKLIELKNKSRSEVNLLLNACDLLLITSKCEGSPVIVKEAIATNCPIVSVDVGDIKTIISDVSNCYICENSIQDITDKCKIVLKSNCRSNGRVKSNQYSSGLIAKKVLDYYFEILNKPTQSSSTLI